jgi:hypothetical protein
LPFYTVLSGQAPLVDFVALTGPAFALRRSRKNPGSFAGLFRPRAQLAWHWRPHGSQPNRKTPRDTIHQVIGWRTYRGRRRPLSCRHTRRPLVGNEPTLIALRGEAAARAIQNFRGDNPIHTPTNTHSGGPNSNTFVAYIGRHVPELMDLPATAIGKDYRATARSSTTPSGPATNFHARHPRRDHGAGRRI